MAQKGARARDLCNLVNRLAQRHWLLWVPASAASTQVNSRLTSHCQDWSSALPPDNLSSWVLVALGVILLSTPLVKIDREILGCPSGWIFTKGSFHQKKMQTDALLRKESLVQFLAERSQLWVYLALLSLTKMTFWLIILTSSRRINQNISWYGLRWSVFPSVVLLIKRGCLLPPPPLLLLHLSYGAFCFKSQNKTETLCLLKSH